MLIFCVKAALLAKGAFVACFASWFSEQYIMSTRVSRKVRRGSNPLVQATLGQASLLSPRRLFRYGLSLTSVLHSDPPDWREPVSDTEPPDVDSVSSELHDVASISEPHPPSNSLSSLLETPDDDISLGISSSPKSAHMGSTRGLLGNPFWLYGCIWRPSSASASAW